VLHSCQKRKRGGGKILFAFKERKERGRASLRSLVRKDPPYPLWEKKKERRESSFTIKSKGGNRGSLSYFIFSLTSLIKGKREKNSSPLGVKRGGKGGGGKNMDFTSSTFFATKGRGKRREKGERLIDSFLSTKKEEKRRGFSSPFTPYLYYQRGKRGTHFLS